MKKLSWSITLLQRVSSSVPPCRTDPKIYVKVIASYNFVNCICMKEIVNFKCLNIQEVIIALTRLTIISRSRSQPRTVFSLIFRATGKSVFQTGRNPFQPGVEVSSWDPECCAARKPFKTPDVLRFPFQGTYKHTDKSWEKKTYSNLNKLWRNSKKTRLKHITKSQTKNMEEMILKAPP